MARQVGQQLLLANTDVGLEIIQGENGFYLSRIYGIASGQDFLSADSAGYGCIPALAGGIFGTHDGQLAVFVINELRS